ncbi:conserved hypothetical protein [Burkholderia sp. 8Y]|uniref:DUF2778 domain-containing protein n=1 Tax=Burkholderia sp. 8Y TaxID=2653133 RepID=UPI0012EF7483|nr:DUF2778 domain-containing protein [Burkholderia sp. 8Y]VXC89154.1 conserved hypothetical protein [Burkholderia sp. 8Y]
MPVRCTFTLNNREHSTLVCEGYGTIEAFSGNKKGRDNPAEIATPDIGPIPPGTYYLIDRRSGGLLGGLRDILTPLYSTDHSKWFALWNPKTGDVTMVNGIMRRNFRLHPEGPLGLSMGCITVVNPAEFEFLQRFIRRSPPMLSVPGSSLKAYGTVTVR